MAEDTYQQSVARRNRARALSELRLSGPLSRTELASRLGLTQTALTRIANEFIDEGIVLETPIHDLRPNRPRALLEINPDWGYVVTLSLMYNLAIGVVDLTGKLIHFERVAGDDFEFHHARYREAFDNLVPETVGNLLKGWEDKLLLGIGVLSAGYVGADGIIIESDDLPRRNVDMCEILAGVTDLAVHVDEEYRLLLQSLLWQEGQEWGSVVALSPGILGCGGGHAFAVGGRVYKGHLGMAGLPGTLMGAPYTDIPGSPVRLAREDIDRFGGLRGYLEAVEQERPEALGIFRKVVANYGFRLGQVINYLNPEAVFLYTPYARLGDSFLQSVRETARRIAEDVSLQNTELRFGGRRSDEERLVAAAVPVLNRVFREGRFRAASGKAAARAGEVRLLEEM